MQESKNKFSVGDKVIVVTEAEDCWYNTGEVYEVSGVNECTGYSVRENPPDHVTVVGEDKCACVMLSDVELYEKCEVQQTEWTDKQISIERVGDKTSVTISGHLTKDDVQSILNLIF